ncbi:MAG: response regulator [Bacteroidetes bacterium]|nr:response regulator [Bacteroidota bacterium]MBK8657299.1 response regulator [Bacteroidota bacterium]
MDTVKNILLVEGDERSAHDILRFLKVSGYMFSVSHVSDTADALNYLHTRRPDLVLLDSAITNHKEWSTLQSSFQRDNVPLVLLSDASPIEAQKHAGAVGATDFLVKNKINLFHLQKTIVTALKLTEAEEKFEHTLTGYVAQNEAFFTVLNQMSEGVLVINAGNAIRYANPKAYSILSEDYLKIYLADYICFRDLNQEQVIEMNPTPEVAIQIRVSKLDWNGEACNLFVFEHKTLPQKQSLENNKTFAQLANNLELHVLFTKADTIVFADKACQNLLKVNAGDIQGKPLRDYVELNIDVQEGISIQSFLSSKQSDGLIKYSDGSTLAVNVVSKPMSVDGELYQMYFLQLKNSDSHAGVPRHRADDDSFSSENVLHLASHDLREPVRTILNYVQLISDKLSEEKYKEANEYAMYAKDAAERMERLLSDLKLYIALNTHKFQLTKVSAKLTVNDVLKSAKQKIQESGAQISVAELPEVSADRELLEKLFAQLIDNAIKFHKKDRTPIVDIGYDKYDGQVVFCVRDNGIGISKKYQQKIFDLFERLNRVDEFTGNGLGLAICKKIVELHGGQIWIESLPGFGSSFYFTLRAK